jgi:hypothetical protein
MADRIDLNIKPIPPFYDSGYIGYDRCFNCNRPIIILESRDIQRFFDIFLVFIGFEICIDYKRFIQHYRLC